MRGVKEGFFAYVGKAGDGRYEPFLFKSDLSGADVEISDDIFLLKAEQAELYITRMTKPPVLTELVVEPSGVTVSPGQTQEFTLKGRDQYGNPIPYGDITWTTTGGTISDSGIFKAREGGGSFTVTAGAGGINGQASVSITALEPVGGEEDDCVTPVEPEPKKPKALSWSGEIPPQKWTQFYTKVLTKLATDKSLNMKLKLEIEIKGDVSGQKRDETRVALQELGLNDEIQEKD